MIRAALFCCLTLGAAAVAAAPPLADAPVGRKDYLPVDDAFQLQPAEWRKGRVVVSWRIAPGYYLYRDRLKFAVAQPDGARLGAPLLPGGESYLDEVFGQVEVYRTELRAELPLSPAAAGSLRVTYQGCADAGLCYPPQTRVVAVDAPP
ncbi:MAG: hypothetical protein HYV18_01240 [Gammaproteobacteria bacterium]|nr:hypothetical protein [Gammaproteobacteria bacterium]